MKIKIWDADNCDESDAKEFASATFDRTSLGWVAEEFAEKRHADCDYPTMMNVHIRAEGKLWKFEVYAEQTLNFRAAEVT